MDKYTIDNMEELARRTKNFTGAEIEGLVKSAASFAFERGIDVKDLKKTPNLENLIITWDVCIFIPIFEEDRSGLESTLFQTSAGSQP